MKTQLTPKQAAMLACIESFIARVGYPPTIRELCFELGYASSSTVHALLEQLARKGYIRKEGSETRTIRVLRSAAPVDEPSTEIERLRRENERMREALGLCTDYIKEYAERTPYTSVEAECHALLKDVEGLINER